MSKIKNVQKELITISMYFTLVLIVYGVLSIIISKPFANGVVLSFLIVVGIQIIAWFFNIKSDFLGTNFKTPIDIAIASKIKEKSGNKFYERRDYLDRIWRIYFDSYKYIGGYKLNIEEYQSFSGNDLRFYHEHIFNKSIHFESREAQITSIAEGLKDFIFNTLDSSELKKYYPLSQHVYKDPKDRADPEEDDLYAKDERVLINLINTIEGFVYYCEIDEITYHYLYRLLESVFIRYFHSLKNY